MNEMSWLRVLNSYSANRKHVLSEVEGSKTCAELGRSIQNLKSMGVVAMLVALATCGGVGQAQQQPGKIPRIGYLAAGRGAVVRTETFRQGLRDLGYVEGKNIAIEYRTAEGKIERYSDLMAELAGLKVDVIFTSSTPGALAAKNATKTIPVVFTNVGDPVENGLVASLARPGGNITGLSTLSPQLSGKGLELLKETIPKLSRVAVVWNPDNPGKTSSFKETEVAARALRLQLQSLEVRGPNDVEPAFQAARKERAGALIVLRDVVVSNQIKRILDLAVKNQMPAIFGDRGFVDAGGLMSYGPNIDDLFYRAATYVEKILKGAKPADLPIERPSKFEFVINLKTAKQIGVTIPANVLARADKVIR
jgi:putative tryptophan/tyrosine transport system substrate-binding protein